jgi:hypothetical protein
MQYGSTLVEVFLNGLVLHFNLILLFSI